MPAQTDGKVIKADWYHVHSLH